VLALRRTANLQPEIRPGAPAVLPGGGRGFPKFRPKNSFFEQQPQGTPPASFHENFGYSLWRLDALIAPVNLQTPPSQTAIFASVRKKSGTASTQLAAVGSSLLSQLGGRGGGGGNHTSLASPAALGDGPAVSIAWTPVGMGMARFRTLEGGGGGGPNYRRGPPLAPAAARRPPAPPPPPGPPPPPPPPPPPTIYRRRPAGSCTSRPGHRSDMRLAAASPDPVGCD